MAAPNANTAKHEGRLLRAPNDDFYPEKESNKLRNGKRASARIMRMPKLAGQRRRRRRRRGDGRIRVGGEKGDDDDFDGTTRTESTLGASCLSTSRTSSEWNSVRAGSKYYATDPAVSAAATYAAALHQQPVKGCMKIRSTEESEHIAPAATHVHDAEATEGEKDAPPKNVSFGTIELREYPRVLGDNPAVTTGPPVTLDWRHQHQIVLPVDEYERGLPERRAKSEFLVPRRVRFEWLLKAGHPRSEVAKMVRQVNRDKERRKRTTHNMRMAWLEEAMQSLIRKALRWIGAKDKDTALYERWLDDVQCWSIHEQEQQKQQIGRKEDVMTTRPLRAAIGLSKGNSCRSCGGASSASATVASENASINAAEYSRQESFCSIIDRARKNDPTLTKVVMFDTALDDLEVIEVADALAKNVTVTWLGMHGTKLNAHRMATIATAVRVNQSLTGIALCSCSINDQACEGIVDIIRGNANLERISLKHNKIRSAGASRIAEALEFNSTLKSLNLSGNKIGKKGAVRLSSALGRNGTLAELDIGSNFIGVIGMASLAAALADNATLVSLVVDNNECDDDRIERRIQWMIDQNRSMHEHQRSNRDTSHRPIISRESSDSVMDYVNVGSATGGVYNARAFTAEWDVERRASDRFTPDETANTIAAT